MQNQLAKQIIAPLFLAHVTFSMSITLGQEVLMSSPGKSDTVSTFPLEKLPCKKEIETFHSRYNTKVGPHAKIPKNMQEMIEGAKLSTYFVNRSSTEVTGISLINASSMHLKELQQFKETLRYLGIYHPETNELNVLSKLKNLEYLLIVYPSPSERNIAPSIIRSANHLGPEDLSALKKLSKLKMLHIENANNLIRIASIAHLTQLKHLTISLCPNIESFEVISNLSNLIYLELGGIPQLKRIDFINDCKNLKIIQLLYLSNLVDLQGVEENKELRSLTITHCEKVASLHELHGLRKIENISLQNTSISGKEFQKFIKKHPCCYYEYYCFSGGYERKKSRK